LHGKGLPPRTYSGGGGYVWHVMAALRVFAPLQVSASPPPKGVRKRERDLGESNWARARKGVVLGGEHHPSD